MEIELKYPSILLGKPRSIDPTQSTVGIDITINSNNNKNSNSLPIVTYNNNNTLPPTTNPIPITARVGDNNSTKSNNNISSINNNGSRSSIGYVAWDFAGQLEYSTLHPVTKKEN